MNKNTLKYTFKILFIVTFFAGCEYTGLGGGQVCTQIGCDDGVTIQISDERPDTLSLTLFLNSNAEAYGTVTCSSQDEYCFIRAVNETPESVTVVIEWNGEEYRQTFTPEYESFRPNGDDCPPVCNTAVIDVDLSGM